MLSVNLSFRSSLAAFAALALVTMTGPASAAAEDGKLDERAVKAAIHYAVELSAQAQKMNLTFLFLAVGVEPERNVEEIHESRAFFRQMLEGFREGDSTLGIPALTGPVMVTSAKLQAFVGLWTRNQAQVQTSAKHALAHRD